MLTQREATREEKQGELTSTDNGRTKIEFQRRAMRLLEVGAAGAPWFRQAAKKNMASRALGVTLSAEAGVLGTRAAYQGARGP